MKKSSRVRSTFDRLIRLAKKRDLTPNHLVTELLLECAAVRLVEDHDLQKHLIFKGGYVGLRIYGSPRYTTDLDAVVHHKNRAEIVEKAKVAILAPRNDNVWFTFKESVNLVTQQEYGGTRLVFRGGIGETPSPAKAKIAQIVNIDIGTGDPVTPAPRIESTPLMLGEGSLTWRVYTVETIVAEKLHAMIRLGKLNSRSKDVFDMHYLLPKTNSAALRLAIEKTFQHRGEKVPEDMADMLRKLDRTILRRGWQAALAEVRPLPDFDTTFDGVVSSLTQLDL